jgi:hypothetical protein
MGSSDHNGGSDRGTEDSSKVTGEDRKCRNKDLEPRGFVDGLPKFSSGYFYFYWNRT